MTKTMWKVLFMCNIILGTLFIIDGYVLWGSIGVIIGSLGIFYE